LSRQAAGNQDLLQERILQREAFGAHFAAVQQTKITRSREDALPATISFVN
jgi:hypothetical protein